MSGFETKITASKNLSSAITIDVMNTSRYEHDIDMFNLVQFSLGLNKFQPGDKGLHDEVGEGVKIGCRQLFGSYKPFLDLLKEKTFITKGIEIDTSKNQVMHESFIKLGKHVAYSQTYPAGAEISKLNIPVPKKDVDYKRPITLVYFEFELSHKSIFRFKILPFEKVTFTFLELNEIEA